MLKKVFFLVALVLCCCPTIGAQEYVMNIRSFGVTEGLSHRNVKSVTLDRNGFIWIGLENGLQRFDGTEFKTWNADTGFSGFSNIRSVVVDDQDWLWAWNSDIDQFVFVHTITEEVQTQEQRFGKKFPTANGTFSRKNWAAFPVFKNEKDGTLYLYNENTIQLISYHSTRGFKIHGPVRPPFPVAPGNIKMVKYQNNRFWMVINGEKNLLLEVDLNGSIKKQVEIAGKNIHYYSGSENEIVLLGELDQTLILVNTSTLQVTYQKHSPFLKVWHAQNHFWGLDNTKIVIRNSMLPGSSLLYSKDTHENQLRLQNATGTYEDPNGHFWIFGTHGLTRISLRQTAFKKYFYLPPTTTPAYNNATRSILVQEGYLYGAFEYQGIAKTSLNEPSYFHPIDGDFQIRHYFYSARGMVLDKDGTLLTTGNGVLKWIKGNQIREERIELKDENNTIIRSLPKEITEIWSLLVEDDEIWIGTSRGLWKRKKDGTYAAFPIESTNYLPIYFIKDKGDFLWLGTDKGLYNFKKETETPNRIKLTGETPAAIYCHSHYKGKDYFGTNIGLVIKDKENKVSVVNKTDGLSGNSIYGVYTDYKGNIWMSTDSGISYIENSSKKITIFTEEDGITHNEFNRMSHYQDEKGNIYFGGLNGITAINPRLIFTRNDSVFPIQITSFEVFSGKDSSSKNMIAQIRTNQQIRLDSDDRFIRLRFAIPGADNKDLLYAWKLDEMESGWDFQKENVLQLASLPYGKHMLYIKGQTNSGKWTTISIAIEVVSPFYFQVWFIILVLCLTAFLIFIAFWIRTKRMEKQQRELEREIEAATEEIVKNKETIEQQVLELQKADEVKTRFFANITHELRTPLTLIKGPISSVLKSGQLDSKNESFLQAARNHTNVLQKLVTSLLDLSKLESGTMKVTESVFSLFEMTRFIVSNFESYAQQAGIEYIFDYKAGKTMFIKLDKEKLEIILNNLISNAVKFTPKGGTITVQVLDMKKNIHIVVRDTGLGIRPEELPLIFDRFYQASNTDTIQTGGTGIGLALSQELAKLLKGNISVESTPEKGSSFTLKIPRYEALGSFASQDPDVRVEENFASTSQAGVKIMIVEDNTSLIEYLKLILSTRYSVCCAVNGKHAVELLNRMKPEELPSLIVSDVMMPEMDGYQLLEYLKGDERYWRIPVVMLTARVTLQDKLKALRIGVDDYIFKPFEEEELQVRIENLLKNAAHRYKELATYENPEQNKPTLSDQGWLADFEKYIRENFADETFSINKTSNHFAMSESTLLKRVKLLTGLSPAEYLREFRLNRGKELLEAGIKQSVAEVAFSVGFSNAKAFSQSFKTRFGKLPSEYLKFPKA